MPASPVTVEDFRGLRLYAESGEANGAVSMLNADFTRGPTQIGTRGGLSRLATGTASYERISPLSSTKLAVLRNTGSAESVETVTISSGAVGSQQTWGGATTAITSVLLVSGGIYIASQTGGTNELVQLYNASTGALTAAPAPLGAATAPRYVARSPIDQRVVMAHFSSAASSPTGANGSTSAVFFSDTGLAPGFSASNWLELDPNDGDPITGMVSWRDQLCVVKRSAIYFFASVSIDSTGNPVFNYRRVTLPSRARVTTNRGGQNIIAGGDGIYLLLADGIYRTTGDTPVQVSRDIAPIFDGSGDSTMLFPASGDWSIGYAANRVFLSYQVGSTYRTLVFDAILGEWLLWDVSAGSSAVPSNVIEWLDTNGLPTTYVASGAKVYSLSKTATSDDGTAITSSYQSGFEGLGYPTQEKKVRDLELVGTGSPTLTVLTDYATTDPLSRGGVVTLGTSPAVAGATHRKSYRGRLFSYKLSGTAPWTIARVTWNVSTVRQPGLRSAA